MLHAQRLPSTGSPVEQLLDLICRQLVVGKCTFQRGRWAKHLKAQKDIKKPCQIPASSWTTKVPNSWWQIRKVQQNTASKEMTNDPARAVADITVSKPRCRKWAACSLTEQTEVLANKGAILRLSQTSSLKGSQNISKAPPHQIWRRRECLPHLSLIRPNYFRLGVCECKPGLSAFLINRLMMSHQMSLSLQCRQYCQCRALL